MWSLVALYGMRWKVEGFLSTFKRIFGEGVRATSREGMFREIRMKVNCYNMLIALAVRLEGTGRGQRPCNYATRQGRRKWHFSMIGKNHMIPLRSQAHRTKRLGCIFIRMDRRYHLFYAESQE